MSLFPNEELPIIGFRGNKKIIHIEQDKNTMTEKINNAKDSFDFKFFVDAYAYLMLKPSTDDNRMIFIKLCRLLVDNNRANHKHLNKKIDDIIERTLAAYYVGYISKDHYLFDSISSYAAVLDNVNKNMQDIIKLKEERDSDGFYIYTEDAHNVQVMEKYVNDKVEHAAGLRDGVYMTILKDIYISFNHYFNQ